MTGMNDLFGTSTTVAAALRSGLLAAVLEGPGTPESLAARTKTDPRATRLVLDVLVTVGLVDRAGSAYTASVALQDTAAKAPLGIEGLARVFGHTEEMLRTGKPLRVMTEAREREVEYRNVVDGLAKIGEAPAAVLAQSLERAPSRILDIGCGSGVWSLAIAQRFAEADVTGLDLPDVVRRFEARAQALGLGSRAHALGADIHETNAVRPASFDLVMIANVLRIEDETRARAIVARAATASSREVIVVDALAQGTPERERARALYTLHLALRSRDGCVHSREQITAWFGEHGMRSARAIDLDDALPAAALVFERM